MNRIRIALGEVVVTATLEDSNTARLLWSALPVESTAQRWGDEVYFRTPVDTGDENAQADVSDDPATRAPWAARLPTAARASYHGSTNGAYNG